MKTKQEILNDEMSDKFIDLIDANDPLRQWIYDAMEMYAQDKIKANKWIKFYNKNGFGWIRIFGAGIKWKDITKHELLFSERGKYTKSFQVSKWRFSVLKNIFEI